MTEAEILNQGLAMAMEFGENWLEPIQARLSERFPHLGKEELDRYNSICQKVMKAGHAFIYQQLEAAAKARMQVEQREVAEKLESFLNQKFPWVDAENQKRLLSQGYYYAYKDGLV